MIKYDNYDDYIKSMNVRSKEMLNQLRSIIKETIPNAEETMSYGVPAFNLKPNAKLDDKIMIAGFKNHVGFYPNPLTIEVFKDRLSEYKVLKGTVQILHKKEIPVELIKEMVLYRYNMVNQK